MNDCDCDPEDARIVPAPTCALGPAERPPQSVDCELVDVDEPAAGRATAPATSVAPIPPVSPHALAPVAPPQSLSPALYLGKLHPYRVIHVDVPRRKTLYYLLKIGAKPGSVSVRHLPPEVARQVAMLSVDHATARFTLHWYPHAEQAQVVEDLPFSALGQAIDDLLGAGFH